VRVLTYESDDDSELEIVGAARPRTTIGGGQNGYSQATSSGSKQSVVDSLLKAQKQQSPAPAKPQQEHKQSTTLTDSKFKRLQLSSNSQQPSAQQQKSQKLQQPQSKKSQQQQPQAQQEPQKQKQSQKTAQQAKAMAAIGSFIASVGPASLRGKDTTKQSSRDVKRHGGQARATDSMDSDDDSLVKQGRIVYDLDDSDDDLTMPSIRQTRRKKPSYSDDEDDLTPHWRK